MYVCMHHMRVPLRRTSVPMLEMGLVGAAPISCSRMYLMVLLTLAFRNACIRKLFVIVLAIYFLLTLNVVYLPFIGFYCLFVVSLHCNCSASATMWVTTERLYILTTLRTTRTRSSPTMSFMVLLTSWISSLWSTISTVLITLAVLPATLDVLLPTLGSLGHALGSLVLFVLQDLLQVDFL